jgi:hypothetical protein
VVRCSVVWRVRCAWLNTWVEAGSDVYICAWWGMKWCGGAGVLRCGVVGQGEAWCGVAGQGAAWCVWWGKVAVWCGEAGRGWGGCMLSSHLADQFGWPKDATSVACMVILHTQPNTPSHALLPTLTLLKIFTTGYHLVTTFLGGNLVLTTDALTEHANAENSLYHHAESRCICSPACRVFLEVGQSSSKQILQLSLVFFSEPTQ